MGKIFFKIFIRCYSGLFRAPKFQFPGKLFTQADGDGSIRSDFTLPGDMLTDRVDVWGSRYN